MLLELWNTHLFTKHGPTITAATYSLAENSTNGTVLGTVEASDPDGDTLLMWLQVAMMLKGLV